MILYSKFVPGARAEPLGDPDFKGSVAARILDDPDSPEPFYALIDPDEWTHSPLSPDLRLCPT